MSEGQSPPPGSMPPSGGAGSVDSMMQQLAQAQGQKGQSNGGTGQAPGMGMPGSAGMPNLPGMPGAAGQKPPRPVGNLVQEGKYLAKDVSTGLLSLLSPEIRKILNIGAEDTPEEAARKQKLKAALQSSNAEAIARYNQQFKQKEAEHKQKEQEEEMEKKRKAQQEQQENQAFSMPSGQKKGAGADQSGKKSSSSGALNQMMQNRKTGQSSAG